jgi:hypothetical protein
MIVRSLSLIALLTSTSAFVQKVTQNRPAFKTTLNMADYTLDPKDTAFVFIEYQNEFATDGGKLHDAVKDVMEKTNSKCCCCSLLPPVYGSPSSKVLQLF